MRIERKIKIAAIIFAALGILAGLSPYSGVLLQIMWAPVIMVLVAMWLITFFAPFMSGERKKVITAQGMMALIVLILAPISAMFVLFFSGTISLLAKAQAGGAVSGDLVLYGAISIILAAAGMYIPTTVNSFIEEFSPDDGISRSEISSRG